MRETKNAARRLARLGLVLPLLLPCAAHAVYFDSVIYEMPSDSHFIARSLLNNTSKSNLYAISAYKIDRPGAQGERSVPVTDGELLYAPLRFSIGPGSREFFKIYYNGPKDDRERYYRVMFKEIPITLFPSKEEQHRTDVIPVVAMSTVLVVRPRLLRFAYKVDEQAGTLENTGNTFFRVIIQQGCNGTDEESIQFYMLPGEVYKNPLVRQKNKKFIVAMQKYIKVGQHCFMPP